MSCCAGSSARGRPARRGITARAPAQVYYVYGFMLLVFLILAVVTSCVTVVGTYFLLNAENYHWQWTSFASAASTALCGPPRQYVGSSTSHAKAADCASAGAAARTRQAPGVAGLQARRRESPEAHVWEPSGASCWHQSMRRAMRRLRGVCLQGTPARPAERAAGRRRPRGSAPRAAGRWGPALP